MGVVANLLQTSLAAMALPGKSRMGSQLQSSRYLAYIPLIVAPGLKHFKNPVPKYLILWCINMLLKENVDTEN